MAHSADWQSWEAFLWLLKASRLTLFPSLSSQEYLDKISRWQGCKRLPAPVLASIISLSPSFSKGQRSKIFNEKNSFLKVTQPRLNKIHWVHNTKMKIEVAENDNLVSSLSILIEKCKELQWMPGNLYTKIFLLKSNRICEIKQKQQY